MEAEKKGNIRDYLDGEKVSDQSISEAYINEDELAKVLRITKRHTVKLRQRGKLSVSIYYRRKFWFPRVEVARFLEASSSKEGPSEQDEQTCF